MSGAYDNPASWLRPFSLDREVVSCASAAAAKQVPLERELKTLLLQTRDTLALAHLRGDRRLSLRAAKQALKTRDVRLAGPSVLDDLGLTPGTVHPFHPNLWPLTHLVSDELTKLNWVTTNAGSLTHFVVFDPSILLRADKADKVTIEVI